MMSAVNLLGQICKSPEQTRRQTVLQRELPATACSRYCRYKTLLDRTTALVLVIPASLVIAALVVIIRLTSKGPGIFRQRRIGQHGKPFTMYKLRSMRVDAEDDSGAIWAEEHDPRTTWVGRILRKLHLDELPQIYNVLRGDMSFVGPRPERPEFVKVLSVALPHYADRQLVLPGVTGLAQLNLPPDRNLECVAKKLALDLAYIENADLGLDMRLAACTLARMIKFHTSSWLGLFGVSRCGKPHPKYVEPDGRLVTDEGQAFSAAQLERQIQEHFGTSLDLHVPSDFERLSGDVPSNGHANGHANGNRVHGKSNGRANGGSNGKSNGHANGDTVAWEPLDTDRGERLAGRIRRRPR